MTARRVRYECAQCGGETDAVPGTVRESGALCRECFGKREDRRSKQLNHLTGKQWAQSSRSVEQYPDTRSAKQKTHGASFPRSLARQQVEIFSKPGDVVLDPFMGVGTTLDACLELGRRGVGVDLNHEFIELARQDLLDAPPSLEPTLIEDDARNLLSHLEPESIDFVLTSPPYGPLLKNVRGAFANKWQEHSAINAVSNPRPYSDDPQDLGNLEYADFLDAISECLAATWKVLKPNTYAVWVVKDFRALKEKIPYVNFHGHLIDRAEQAGFVLWDIRIFDQTKFRPLVCLGYPSRNFYLNIGHSYLVTLKRP